MARIAILEDQTLVLNLYCQLVNEYTPHEVVLSSDSAVDFLEKWKSADADLILLDLVLPDGDGVQIAREIICSTTEQDPKVLIVSGEVTEIMVRRALKAGVHGFVDKLSPASVFVAAVEKVLAGKRFLSRRVRELTRQVFISGHALESLLSASELRLLPLFALGHTNVEVAEMASLSAATAQTHRRNVMSKLGVHSTVELVCQCFKVGIVVKQSDGTLSAPPWDDRFALPSSAN